MSPKLTNPKTLSKIGNLLHLKKNCITILRDAYVVDGDITMTNLDIWTRIHKSNIPAGRIDMAMLAKTRDLAASVCDVCDVSSDDPVWPAGERTETIPTAIFNRDYTPYLDYASRDEAKGMLQNLNFCDGLVWACDGHRAMIDDSTYVGPLSLTPDTVKILAYIRSVGETVQDATTIQAAITGTRYLRIITENMEILSRISTDQIPDLKKIIPDVTEGRNIELSADQLAELKKTIETIRPYVEDLIIIDRNRIFSYAGGVEIYLSFPLFEFPIGINPNYLLTILNRIDHAVTVHYYTAIRGVYITNTGGRPNHLIMPVRITDEEQEPPMRIADEKQESPEGFRTLTPPKVEASKAMSGKFIVREDETGGFRVTSGPAGRELTAAEYRQLTKIIG